MVGKAKKSTHKKSKLGKKIREASKAVDSEDYAEKNYELMSIGPIYLQWGKKRVKNDRGKVVKKYYIKKAEKHHVWVHWKSSFAHGEAWSAEPQDSFGDSDKMTKKEVEKVLAEKVIWPWPSKGDGINDDGHEDRIAVCKNKGYKAWKGSKKETKWNLTKALGCTTGTSDTGTSGTSDAENDTPDETTEEEEDEV